MATLALVDERLRHTDDEITAGREGIQAVRARLGQPRALPERHTTDPDLRETVAVPHLEAEMAWGAERERLDARIRALKTEVAHLCRALATILREAATAVSPPAHQDGDR